MENTPMTVGQMAERGNAKLMTDRVPDAMAHTGVVAPSPPGSPAWVDPQCTKINKVGGNRCANRLKVVDGVCPLHVWKGTDEPT